MINDLILLSEITETIPNIHFGYAGNGDWKNENKNPLSFLEKHNRAISVWVKKINIKKYFFGLFTQLKESFNFIGRIHFSETENEYDWSTQGRITKFEFIKETESIMIQLINIIQEEKGEIFPIFEILGTDGIAERIISYDW